MKLQVQDATTATQAAPNGRDMAYVRIKERASLCAAIARYLAAHAVRGEFFSPFALPMFLFAGVGTNKYNT